MTQNNYIDPISSPSIPSILRWIRETSSKINNFFRRATPSVSSASSNVTTTGNSIIVATAAITVSLNPAPADLEFVTVKRITAAGSVVVNGNGNTIDGASSSTLATNYDVFSYLYSSTAGEWIIV